MTKKPKKKPPFNQNSHIRSALRRAFSRSPIVYETMKKVRRESVWYKQDGSKAKKPRVEYQCFQCKQWFMGKEIQVDHCIPVVDPEIGFTHWIEYIDRLFCGPENLTVLCKPCHLIKSNNEKAIAKERRKHLKNQQSKV